ncbi:MAG: hypothetical protein ICV69_06155 [Thermoleophilaceae bacterium]|nr:hypothetical protein [Thermoleophilaceae bacterium]
MPIEVSVESLRIALARLGEHDLDAPGDVERALEWIAVRDGPDAPLTIRRYDLQAFLWYRLPCKLLTSPEHKRAVAARLGRFFELVGGRATEYARICTSEETVQLLRTWHLEGPRAGRLLREALRASGIEPPDTDALRWGAVMGPEEATIHDEVALELERALEDRRLDPAARGFGARRKQLVEELLRRRLPELGGRAPLDLVAEERLEHWLRRGSEQRRGIVGPVEPLLRVPASLVNGDAGTLAPLAWLLDAAGEGIALTQTGALNLSLVRAAVERFPEWWWGGSRGPPRSEGDVASLCETHALPRRMRALRRRGRRLLLTRRGEELRGDCAALLRACAPHLIPGEGFEAAVGELAAAVLLRHETVDRDDLEAAVHAAIVADGWNADGEPPDLRDVAWAAAAPLRLAEALGLVGYESEFEPGVGFTKRDLTPTPAGHEALRLCLRARALAPATLP